MFTVPESLTLLSLSIPLTAIIVRYQPFKNNNNKNASIKDLDHIKELFGTENNFLKQEISMIQKKIENLEGIIKEMNKDIASIKSGLKILLERREKLR